MSRKPSGLWEYGLEAVIRSSMIGGRLWADSSPGQKGQEAAVRCACEHIS